MNLSGLDTARLHFSASPRLDLDKKHESLGTRMKPSGLWWSCGFSWVEWCLTEEFHTRSLRHVYKINLDESRIRKIDSVPRLKKFDGRYGCTRYLPTRNKNYDVNWVTVGRRHSGIEINPYQREMRHSNAFWYYSWDVASGCVWRRNAIVSAEYLGTVTLKDLRAHRGVTA